MGLTALALTACQSKNPPADSIVYDTKGTASALHTTAMGENETPAEKPIWQKPTAPMGWKYPEINLSEGKYTPTALDPAALARKLGYQDGTYEYDYFRALSGISFYARIASNKVSSAVKNTAVSELAAGFFEVITREDFIAPYEDILYHTFSLLKESDFTLFADNEALIAEYQNTLTYQWDKPTEIWYTAALSFADIDTKLTEYASVLLNLKEKYPDYTGEFTLSSEALSEAQAIVESCVPVAENRSGQWAAWEAYFKEATPQVTAQTEFIQGKDTVKITFTSDYPLYVMTEAKYIVDFQGEIIETEHSQGYLYYEMEPPVVCYVPISLLYKTNGVFKIRKFASDGKSYADTITVDIDFSQYFSNEPITVSDPFLDAVLKKEFGGSYSEEDLSQIGHVQIAYYPTKDYGGMDKLEPFIRITYHNIEWGMHEGSSYYAYSDFFEEDWAGEFPMELLDDMEYFPLLKSITFHQSGEEHNVPLPEGYPERILTKEYTAEDFEP